MRLLSILFVLFLLAAVEANAQAMPSQLQVGERVRLRTGDADARRVVGLLTAVTDDSLVLALADSSGSLGVRTNAIQSLEVSAGFDRSGWAGKGAAVGLVAGYALGMLCAKICSTDPTGGANLAPIGGMIYGPIVGAVAGAVAAPEKWRRVR